MTFYRRRENPLDSLLRWRRNVFLQHPDGGYVLFCATRFLLVQHYFDGSLRGDPARTEYLDPVPGLFDGNAWNVALLSNLIQPERTIMSDKKPWTAFYSRELRAAISQMTDDELRMFVTIATYIGETGMCDPGVRALMLDSGIDSDKLPKALDGLRSKGLMTYLRQNERDELTGRMRPNVVTLNPQIFRHNLESGIHTYMFESLIPVLRGKFAQAESPEAAPELEPPKAAPEAPPPPPPKAFQSALEGVGACAPGKDQIGDSDSQPEKPEPATPAATPQPARSATNTPSPGSAPPPPAPPDAGQPLTQYAEPLPAPELEALANELYYAVDQLQIAKARQLIVVYGTTQIRTALALYHRQKKENLTSPAGWFIVKVREGALVPALDGEGKRDGKSYTRGFEDFIES